MRIKIVLLILLIFPLAINAEDSSTTKHPLLPGHFVVQHAGNTGYISAGFGWEVIRESYHVELSYGYVPEFTGSKEIHTISVKNKLFAHSWNPLRRLSLDTYFNLNINYTIGEDFFIELPSHYPDHYYWQTALHFAPGMGIVTRLDTGSATQRELFGFYTEISTLDIYIINYFRSDYLKLKDIFNIAFGLIYCF